jgi:hypothetical protein
MAMELMNLKVGTSARADVADHQIRLRFFDRDVIIRSDSPAYIDLFARMYSRFQLDAETAANPSSAAFAIWTRPDNPWGEPVLDLNGEIWPLEPEHTGQGYIYDSILGAIVAGVRSHFLIHAGVVSWWGRGVILAGDSGHGKTTLVLELVRRGFKFLSDEMAALNRAERRVDPFPRCLRVQPGSLDLADWPAANGSIPEWYGKLLLDIETLQPNSLGVPAAISHIIMLKDPAAPPESSLIKPGQELCILVNRLDEALLTDVKQVEGVSRVGPDVVRGYPAIRCRAIQRMSVLARIEALCRQHGVLILDISKRLETRPAFDTPARLLPLTKSQTVVELLRQFQGGHKSALLQEEFGGSSPRLFLELAGLIGQAQCHKLCVGSLHQAADLICSLIQ